MSNQPPINSEQTPPQNFQNRNITAARNSSSPGPSARPPVRRLSQLEPVHIAALNQEYRSQIREAAKAELHSDAQREHYEKARKIKILLEKYDIMVQEQRKKQHQQQQLQANHQSSPALSNSSQYADSAIKSDHDVASATSRSISSTPPPQALQSQGYPKSVSPQPTSMNPSISQQMAANTSRYQYSQQNSSHNTKSPSQLNQPNESNNSAQYSQFRVQLSESSNNSPSTPINSNSGGAGSSTPSGSSGPYYNKGIQGNLMQYQQMSSEPLTLQLERYKQIEKETQDQLSEVERTIRDTPNLDAELRLKLRQQEQNLRTKRDQYKSMALTVTQQLQSSMVKQQKLQNQKQAQKVKQQDKGKGAKFNSTKPDTNTPSPKPYQSYNSAQSQQQNYNSLPASTQSDSQSIPTDSLYQRSYGTASSNGSRQSLPSAISSPSVETYTSSYGSSYISQPKYPGNLSSLPTSATNAAGIMGRAPKSPNSSHASSPSLPGSLSGTAASLGSSLTGAMSGGVSSNIGNMNLGPKVSGSGQYKHSAQGLTKSHTLPTGKTVRGPGKVGRPPLTPNAANAKRMPLIPPPSAVPIVIPEKVFNKRKINELIKGLMPEDMDGIIENEVEDLVGDLVEEFVDNVTTFACRLAKHRKADYVETKDVHVHLERNWNIRVPGFPGDEVSIVRRTVPSKSYSTKLDMINATKSYGGVSRY